MFGKFHPLKIKIREMQTVVPSSGWSEETTLSVDGAIGDVLSHGRNKIDGNQSRGYEPEKKK